MISVLDVLTNENFKSWVVDNESMLALIARQGGSEGVLRSFIGAQFQLIKPDLIFVSEKYRVDLILYSHSKTLICEFKHNFVEQKFSLIEDNFYSAIAQVMIENGKITSDRKYREVVLFLVQICSVGQLLPSWAEKYHNNSSSNAEACNAVIELVKGLNGEVGGIAFKLASDGHLVFDLCAEDIVEIKLHAFVYQNK
jgi:hypothetical protein